MNEFDKFIANLVTAAEKLSSWVETIDWEKVHQKILYLQEGLPKDLEDESIQLMNKGWFIWFFEGDIDNFYEKAHSLFGTSDIQQDLYMENYIADNMHNFKSELINSYPNREGQIEDAFKTHELELYYASIPVLLALSEGIGRDLCPGVGIFSKQNPRGPKAGLPKTDDIFDSISGLEVFEEAVLKPLRVSSQITKTIHHPTNEDRKLLNRHLIMHGNSDLYGNKINSLKAISLVYFVHSSLTHLQNSKST
ncbi:hypothetical protein [Aliivibrio fischeri]|uniref:hypothetical protein n=1 Tax=Aliivibrio fischeri TaxID=668 RepID=UPI0012D9D550|nr:hypothetical protein [Aliivibrio fischeri]MUK26591.1 hypothetical protein [Aliivibrio fischeri]MUK33299.1 hypothetical protein [Aliivibrio fischeri]